VSDPASREKKTISGAARQAGFSLIALKPKRLCSLLDVSQCFSVMCSIVFFIDAFPPEA
jgi:hypothetical protein